MARYFKRFVIVVDHVEGVVKNPCHEQFYNVRVDYRVGYACHATTFLTASSAKKHLKELVLSGKADSTWSVIPAAVERTNDFVGA